MGVPLWHHCCPEGRTAGNVSFNYRPAAARISSQDGTLSLALNLKDLVLLSLTLSQLGLSGSRFALEYLRGELGPKSHNAACFKVTRIAIQFPLESAARCSLISVIAGFVLLDLNCKVFV